MSGEIIVQFVVGGDQFCGNSETWRGFWYNKMLEFIVWAALKECGIAVILNLVVVY